MWKNNFARDLILLTLLLALLFGTAITIRTQLANPDEGRYAEIPREMLANHDYLTPTINNIQYFEKPILFYWMQAASYKIFGIHIWSARLITALMGILGCLFTYITTRQLYDRKSAWLASLILASSILYFAMSAFITIDMTVTAWLTGCLFSFLLATRSTSEKSRKNYLYAFYIFSALATLTKGLIGILFPGMIIFTWILLLNDWRNLKNYLLPGGILVWLILVLPWHILMQLKHPQFFDFYIVQQHFARYLTSYAHRQQPLYYLPLVLILGFLPWTLFLISAIRAHWPSWRLRHSQKEVLFLLLWAGLIYAFFQCSQSLLPPYLLPIFPPLAVLLGHYFSTQWQRQHHWAATITLGIFLLPMLIFGLCFLIPLLHFPVNRLSGASLILTSLILFFIYWHRGLKMAFLILFSYTLLLLLLTGLFYPVFQTNSTQLLTNKLKPWLKPQDVVASYHSYFQDLPFYLQRRIVIVGYGVQELEFGMQHQNMQNWLIADANFPAWWHSQNRIYLFTNIKNYLQLKKTGLQPLYVVFGPYPSKIGIVSNQPLPPIPIQLKATNLEFFKEEGK